MCAFYVSQVYGSEYRAGFEFVKFAAANGFDLAVIADLENNCNSHELEAAAPGIRVVRIPSLVKRQASLYRYSDFVAQTLWHRRVVDWLRRNTERIDCVWIQNGAAPWLPLVAYFDIAPVVLWGPVGGGESPSPRMARTLTVRARLREALRSRLERAMLGTKVAALKRPGSPRLVVLARTADAQRQLEACLKMAVPLIPEILDPIEGASLTRMAGDQPAFVWVGQDLPRKNLRLALSMFEYLRREFFPNSTLDVFGCNAPTGSAVPNVRFHGWVPRVDWERFRDDGVLLLTSFREGLPSALLEAVRNGLLCVTSDVGAIGRLGIDSIFVLPREEYPDFSDTTMSAIGSRIRQHLGAQSTTIAPVSFRADLLQQLRANGLLQ